jgi:hypothetical protein
MPTAKLRASTILAELELAQRELVGKAVILTDGKAGTVDEIWLDEAEFRSEVTEVSGRYRPSNWHRRIDDGADEDLGFLGAAAR